MTTHYDGTEEERLALDAYIKLLRAHNSVVARLKRQLGQNNLTFSQLGVLESLLHLGQMCQSDISEKLLLSSGNITTVVDNLEKRGLVRRTRNAGDRRFVDVSLTREGQALIADYFPEHVANIVAAFEVLTPEEERILATLCKKLGLANAG